MSTESDSNWQQVRGYRIPVDMVGILSLLVVLAASVILVSDSLVWRLLIGGPLLVFVPGYSLLAVLFPRSGTQPNKASVRSPNIIFRSRRLRLRDRVVLAIGMSVTLIPILGIVLAATGLQFTRLTVVGTLSMFTVCCVLSGIGRRLQVPPEQRFRLPIDQWTSDARSFLFGGNLVDSGINLFLVGSILIGLGTAGYAVAVPQQDTEFTSFALLTRTSDGAYQSSQYPTTFTQGQSQELVVSVTNHRRTATEYTIVTELQQVRTDGKQVRVLSQREQRRFSVEVAPDETWRRPHQVTPDRAGTNLRLVYYLYRGDGPPDASAATANQRLQLWINVSAPATRNSSSSP